MSLKGGYKVIDLKDTNFVLSEGQTVPGVYEAIKTSHRKPILLTGIKIAGTELGGRFTVFGESEENYISDPTISIDTDLLRLTVTPADLCTFAVNE